MVFVELFKKNELIKRQELALRQREREAIERRSEARYRQLTDLLPEIMWAGTPEGEIYYSNRVLQAYTGLAAGDVKVERLTALTHEDDREQLRRELGETFATGEPFELQFRLRNKAGEYRWFLGRTQAERDEHGKIAGFISTATDIEDAKQAEAALRKTQGELERANAIKDEFVAAASHELRTPLQAAKGHAHLTLMKLGPDQADSPVGKGLRTVMRQIDRMTQLVENLLDVSRIQAGRLQLEVEPFNFAELLHDVCDRTGGLSNRHQLALDSPDPLPVTADRSRLEQVVTNLLSNAIRYSPEGGKIEIRAAAESDAVHLAVKDLGRRDPEGEAGGDLRALRPCARRALRRARPRAHHLAGDRRAARRGDLGRVGGRGARHHLPRPLPEHPRDGLRSGGLSGHWRLRQLFEPCRCRETGHPVAPSPLACPVSLHARHPPRLRPR